MNETVNKNWVNLKLEWWLVKEHNFHQIHECFDCEPPTGNAGF